MDAHSTEDSGDFSRFALCAAALACLAVALTALTADADEPPTDEVRRALEVAERAAATERALQKIGENGAADLSSAGQAAEPPPVASVPDDWEEAGLDLSKAERLGDELVQTLPSGARVTFTVDPDLQSHLEAMFENYAVPHGGVVVLEPSTGRVLAMVSHSDHDPDVPSLSRKSRAPSASVFKIVTAAALLETGAVTPDEKVCYHGGVSRLTARNIKGDPARDHKCADLEHALAFSINSVVAKLTYHRLDRRDLVVWAERFGYNAEIPFELSVEPSRAEDVADPLERARMAAGFWHSYLSPLHGAMIAAAVKNDGVMMAPSLIEEYVSPAGDTLQTFEPEVFRRVMSRQTADTLASLLQETARDGTADRYFARRPSFPNDVTVGGKTGTLSEKRPYLGFTWFVGYGSHDELDGTDAAVAGLVGNTPKWRIKGAYAASEAMRKYFDLAEKRAQSEGRLASTQ